MKHLQCSWISKLMIMLFEDQRSRFLIAGGWNTVFGYAVGPTIYYAFGQKLHTLIVGALASCIAISMAFLTYKIFVFRTRGAWLAEYLRCYVVYGGTSLISIVCLWVLVDGFNIPFWVAQLPITMVTIVVSFFSHSRFTFKNR